MLKEGMYVRCPVDYEDEKNPRMFALGRVTQLDNDFGQLEVEFDTMVKSDFNIKEIFSFIPDKKTYMTDEVSRCKVLDNSEVILFDFSKGKIVCYAEKDEEGYYYYYIMYDGGKTIKKVREDSFMTHFTRVKVDPIDQMLNYEFHNPFWYQSRCITSESMHILKNAPYGFKDLIGARAHLMVHQVDTIVRAIGEDSCRLMLADEVGLGKTVEACVVMKGLKSRYNNFKTLIIVPDSLCKQWQNELDLKLWDDVPIWKENMNINSLKIKELILPLEKINSFTVEELLKNKWDLCIVDEAHRLIGANSEYNKILTLSENVNNLLLLSATPIQERKGEYLKLLTLLNPIKYKNMNNAEFEKLYQKSNYIRNKVYSLFKDLKDYIEDDLVEDYIEDFKDIAAVLEDSVVDKLIEMIDPDSDDSGLEIVKILLAYISENYQIERNIIRHRRAEIKDKLASRSAHLISYEMRGSDANFYEDDTYEKLVTYLSDAIYNIGSKDNLIGEFVKVLLSAMFSSPWALLDIIKLRKESITSHRGAHIGRSNLEVLNTPRREEIRKQNVVQALKGYDEELGKLDELERTCKLWANASFREFNKLEELYNDPDLIKGRLVKILDFIRSEDDNTKYVLFTSWSKTVEYMKTLLQEVFGEQQIVCFYSKMTDTELQESVDKFQCKKDCRFMICDELGGEGRNFQLADKIVHIDLPWSPIILEQRIGRLDRIGRAVDKDVESIVVYSDNTIEENLFSLLNDGLNIFNESLSGMEIALEDVQKNILEALKRDVKYGLSEVIEKVKEDSIKMREVVERERYYDMARQLDISTQRQFDKLISKFDDNGGKLLGDTMLRWALTSGLRASDVSSDETERIISFTPSGISFESIRKSMFMIPDTKEAIKRSKYSGRIVGTFSRKEAVNKENLVFFAPEEPIFDSIIKNSEEGFRGRCCAILKDNTGISWQGFIFKWNIHFKIKELIENGIDIAQAGRAQGYLPLDQITSIIKIHGESSENNDIIIEQLMERRKSYYHLGQRTKYSGKSASRNPDESNLQWFKQKCNKDMWEIYVKKAYKKSIAEVKNKVVQFVDKDRINSDFDKIINGYKASNIYFENSNVHIGDSEKLKRTLDCVKKGIFKANLELDSVAFIWMVK